MSSPSTEPRRESISGTFVDPDARRAAARGAKPLLHALQQIAALPLEVLTLEPEWSADKGWSATAQDAVQDAFIELSLGRGTVRHAAFRQALDTLPTSALGLADHGKEASRAADRVPPLRVLHAELCEERAPIEELSLAQMRSLSAALVERLLRRRAAVRQAAKVSKQVDSALLRELLGVDEGARFVPVAAVIALLRDAAGAELPLPALLGMRELLGAWPRSITGGAGDGEGEGGAAMGRATRGAVTRRATRGAPAPATSTSSKAAGGRACRSGPRAAVWRFGRRRRGGRGRRRVARRRGGRLRRRGQWHLRRRGRRRVGAFDDHARLWPNAAGRAIANSVRVGPEACAPIAPRRRRAAAARRRRRRRRSAARRAVRGGVNCSLLRSRTSAHQSGRRAEAERVDLPREKRSRERRRVVTKPSMPPGWGAGGKL